MACLVLEVVIVVHKWTNHLVSLILITMDVLGLTIHILVLVTTTLVTVHEPMGLHVRVLLLVLA